MRIWLRPDRLAQARPDARGCHHAIKEQNLQAPAGQVGAAPSPPGPGVHLHGEGARAASSPPRSSTTSSSARPRAAVSSGSRTSGGPSSGSENYSSFGRAIVKDSTGNGRAGAASLPCTCCPAPTSSRRPRAIYQTLEEFATFFPSDVAYKIVYDTTPSVEASIERDHPHAVRGVHPGDLVVFVFLQNFRATLIPLLTVPVALDRHVHLLPAARLLDQHAHDVRPGAGDRHRGGRRHRRRRGGDAPHRARQDRPRTRRSRP